MKNEIFCDKIVNQKGIIKLNLVVIPYLKNIVVKWEIIEELEIKGK